MSKHGSRCMERPPRREASKVVNFRKFHLSGDLEEVVSGKVSNTINRWENSNEEQNITMTEQVEAADLKTKIQEQREQSI